MSTAVRLCSAGSSSETNRASIRSSSKFEKPPSFWRDLPKLNWMPSWLRYSCAVFATIDTAMRASEAVESSTANGCVNGGGAAGLRRSFEPWCGGLGLHGTATLLSVRRPSNRLFFMPDGGDSRQLGLRAQITSAKLLRVRANHQ